MATIYTVSSGNWSDPNIWSLGRVPQDSDDVIIENGHVVIYDYDMSSFVNGLNSLRINGNNSLTVLKASRDVNSVLKVNGYVSGSKLEYSVFDWGRENDVIPINVVAKVIRRASQMWGNNLQIYFYGADPGVWITTINRDVPAGSNIIYVDVLNGFRVNVGDRIWIEVDYSNYVKIERVVIDFDVVNGIIVLDKNIPFSVSSGNYVVKLSRNLIIEDNTLTANYVVYVEKMITKWGNLFYEKSGFLGLSNWVYIKNSVFLSSMNGYIIEGVNNLFIDNCFLGNRFIFYNTTAKISNSILNAEYISRFSDLDFDNVKVLNTAHIDIRNKVFVKNSFYRNFEDLIYLPNNYLVFKDTNFEKYSKGLAEDIRKHFGTKAYLYNCPDVLGVLDNLKGGDDETYVLYRNDNLKKFKVLNCYGKAVLNTSIKKSFGYSLQFNINYAGLGGLIPFLYYDFRVQGEGNCIFLVFVYRNSSEVVPKLQVLNKFKEVLNEASGLLVGDWELLRVSCNLDKGEYIVRLRAEGLGDVYWDVDPFDDNFFQRAIMEKGERVLEVIELPSDDFEVIEL